MSRIPFSLPDVGLTEIKGLVSVDEGKLVLRIDSSLLGLLDTDEDVIQIEPDELEEIRVKRGLFRDRLVITPWETDVLDRVPGRHPSSLELRIWRKHRDALEHLVDRFEGITW
jgi:hypothetical protein